MPLVSITPTHTPTPTHIPTPTYTPAPVYMPTPTAVPEECRIKGNINMESGERVYHTPGSPWYDRTQINTDAGERWFCTEQEAHEAGWRAPQKAQPAATVVPSEAHAGCEAIVNINAADVEELEKLPGIGEVLAQRIIEYRSANGEFSSIEDLDNVKGIGEKTLEKLAPCVALN